MNNDLISLYFQEAVSDGLIDLDKSISKEQPFKEAIDLFSRFCALKQTVEMKESLINYGFASQNFNLTDEFFIIRSKIEKILSIRDDETNNMKNYLFRLKQTIQGRNPELTEDENFKIKNDIVYFVLSYFICPGFNNINIKDELKEDKTYVLSFTLKEFFLYYLPPKIRLFLTVHNDNEMKLYWTANNIADPFLTAKWVLEKETLSVILTNPNNIGIHLTNLQNHIGKLILQMLLPSENQKKQFFFITEWLYQDYKYKKLFRSINNKSIY